jgi:ribosomal protein S12 methylthiotransferase
MSLSDKNSRPKTVALVTFGCAKNLVDSEVMLGHLRRASFLPITDEKKADVVILNTCGFIRPAREEAERGIEAACSLKKKHGPRTLVVTGCYVEREGPELRRRYPEVDVWLGVKDYDHIVPAVEGTVYPLGRATFLCSHTSPRLLSTPATWAYLKISEGCSHRCSFCAIPLIKGPYRSRTIASILKEARGLVRRGIKEINLVSQDTTYFGRDREKRNDLVLLLRRLADVRGLRWIRLLYGYPEEVTPGLLEVMAEEKICSYLDLPFQHADRRVLKRMKRSIDHRRALSLIEKIRKKLPDVALRTSVIVGFPGERRSEFEELKRFVAEARFEHLGVFTYSPEKGTAAFRWGDPIPEEEKVERQAEVMRIQAKISREINRSRLHQRLDVLMETFVENKRGVLVGRTRFQAPEVDGVVIVRDRRQTPQPVRPIEKVEITATRVYDLHGIISE